MSLKSMSAELSAVGVRHRVIVAVSQESSTDDKHAQEAFAKRLVRVAQAVGFNKTKIVVSKDAGDKYVVYAYLSRIGDNMDSIDSRAYRVDTDLVTEYHPMLVENHIGLHSWHAFNVNKLKKELTSAFDIFIKHFGE